MVNYQTLDSFLDKRKNQVVSTGKIFPEDTDIAIGGVRKLNAAILVFDIADSSQFNDDDFVRYISPFLHMAFHIVNTREGIVDKYTGDGAMVSFCGKNMTDKEACTQAMTTALDISDVATKLKSNYKFPAINIRIGVDFGSIQVERIGVRGKTQLIIVGKTAISAKRLETVGKQIDFDLNSTICLGYDVHHNLSEKGQGLSSKITPDNADIKAYFQGSSSSYTKQKPYTIFRYRGRYRK